MINTLWALMKTRWPDLVGLVWAGLGWAGCEVMIRTEDDMWWAGTSLSLAQ